MREQAAGANLLQESVSRVSSLMCTEICLPWHDVSLVCQSNPQVIANPNRAVSSFSSLVVSFVCTGWVLTQERVSGACVRSKLPRVYRPLKPRGCRPSVFYCFRAFGNLVKPGARVFEITSPTKNISLNYHLNKFPQFEYFISDLWLYHLHATLWQFLNVHHCHIAT